MTAAPATISVTRGAPLRGTIALPGDKSITQRALLCAALAEGDSRIVGALDSADTRATSAALAALGAEVDWSGDAVRVHGTGGRWRAPRAPLDLGNSATGLRLLAGAIAGRGIAARLTGDASLRRRPMERITAPLAAMGAAIGSDDGRAPLNIEARSGLRAIHYRLPVASAQVKAALLFAALAGDGESRIEDPFGTRDHAERMLPLFGARIEIAGATVALRPGPLAAAEVRVPGDLSAAAFAIAAALLVPGSRLRIANVGVNPGRDGCLRAFSRMGARIARSNQCSFGAEPVADLAVKSGSLRGIRVPADEIPRLIDEIPVLLVLAAVAAGETVIEGAGELRYKESDRIETMRAGLEALGAKIAVQGDDITIRGGGLSRGGRVPSGGDHRVAMALALAGLVTPQAVSITEAGWIATSFPDFVATLREVGVAVRAAA